MTLALVRKSDRSVVSYHATGGTVSVGREVLVNPGGAGWENEEFIILPVLETKNSGYDDAVETRSQEPIVTVDYPNAVTRVWTLTPKTEEEKAQYIEDKKNEAMEALDQSYHSMPAFMVTVLGYLNQLGLSKTMDEFKADIRGNITTGT